MSEDTQNRITALQQAAHDCRGQEPAEEVVKRAEVYYLFLIGPPTPA